MRCTHSSAIGPASLRPDQLDDPIPEPNEVDKFLEELLTKFQASQTAFLDQVHNFVTILGEGLPELATRFDECALPVLRAHLAIERDMYLVLRTHILVFLRKVTYSIMNVQDKKRRAKGIECSNRQELIEISAGVERNIVAFEAEMRSANQPPPPRSTHPCLYMFENERVVPIPREEPRQKRPMAERLGGQAARIPLKDRLGSKGADLGRLDTRLCHECHQAGHIARMCPNPRVDARDTPPLVVVATVRVNPLAKHRTDKAVCARCSKPRHTIAQF